MGILDEDVARVRDSTDLVALVGEHLALKRVGGRYRGLCPFHQEKTASFYVNPELGVYKCFGCGVSGDAITFVREMEHLDFVDAVERLAARGGIQLRYDDKRANQDRSRKTRLAEAVGAAMDEYHRLLLDSPDAGLARRYLRSRGFDGDAVRRFKLGWAPDEWDHLSRLLQKAGYKREDLVESGLAFVNRVNKLQDQFRKRLMFPIYDARGEPAGFGGRDLDGDGPKYKNSPENPLYHKSRVLYGLNWAKADVVAQGQVIVCEGYTDVMAFALAGVPNAVATCGTALTDDHVRSLKNLARKVVLAYDADAAGQGAAEKWYGWEAEYDIEVRVANLPDGRDPGDLWPDDPEALRNAVASARAYLMFRIERAMARHDLDSIEGRGRAGDAVAKIIAEHPSEFTRDQYVMEAALQLKGNEDSMRVAVVNAQAHVRSPPPAERPRYEAPPTYEDRPRVPPRRPIDRRELDLLRWAIHEPEMVADWLDVELFGDPLARAVFELLAQSATFRDALDASEGDAREVLERLAVEEPIGDGEPQTVAARLLVNAAEPRGAELLQRLLDAGDDRASEVKRSLDELAHGREVGDWSTAEAAARRLVGWVVL